MSLRGLLLRLLAWSISFTVGLAAVELALRLAAPGVPTVVDTAVVEPLKTRHKGVDWRDRRPPGDKPAATFRVLAIGDSFVWGDGVHSEDAWPGRLERRLNELDSDHVYEVVNWSRPGWSTAQAWRATDAGLASLEPDLMILGFTLNDPEPEGQGRRGLLYEPLTRRSPVAAPSRALYRHSVLYRLLWNRLENRRQRRAFTAYYENLFIGPDWEECRRALAGFRDGARARSVPLLLAVFPVFDSQLDDAYPYRELHHKVRATAAELGIAALDLLETYRGIDARRLAVTPFTNPHPNELAHRIAADELAIHLVKEQLIPARFPPEVKELPTAVSRR